MFVRFRASAKRLQLSLVETRRSNGSVHHEHIASLGSIATPPSVADRVPFWNRLHQRLAKLSNRIDAENQGKILAAVHVKIPMPTIQEQRGLQLDNAKADAAFWGSLHEMRAGAIEDHKGLAAAAERKAAELAKHQEETAQRKAAAQDRIERIEKGEDVVGGLGKSMTKKDWVKALGLSRSDLRHMDNLNVIYKAGLWDTLMDEISKRRRLSEKAPARKLTKAIKDWIRKSQAL